jgi:hypothetical protein
MGLRVDVTVVYGLSVPTKAGKIEFVSGDTLFNGFLLLGERLGVIAFALE